MPEYVSDPKVKVSFCGFTEYDGTQFTLQRVRGDLGLPVVGFEANVDEMIRLESIVRHSVQCGRLSAAWMRNALLVFCSVVMASACFGKQLYVPQTADPMLEPWRWQKEVAFDDLSVLCMAESGDGSLWFGNVGSVAHYDGVTVTVYPFDEALMSIITSSKKIPWANALTVLPDGRPLILIGESLVLRTDAGWEVVVQDVGESIFSARIEQAEDGTVWLSVPEYLWRISENLKDATVVLEASPDGFIGSFCIDPTGTIWVVEKAGASEARLQHMSLKMGSQSRGYVWEMFPLPVETDAYDMRITAGHDGRIWYADNARGSLIHVFEPETARWAVFDEFNSKRIYYLSTGRDGTIWAGGENYILKVSPTKPAVFYSDDQLEIPNVPLSFYETQSNRLWVIGRIGYVYSVDVSTSEWITYEGLHYECELPDGKQWFRGREGRSVVVHDPQVDTWLEYRSSDGVLRRTHSLYADSRGLIWAVGHHDDVAAIAVFDGSKWTRFLHPDFAEWIEPKALMEARDGTMWFGAGGKLISEPGAGGALQYEVDEGGVPRLLKHHRKNGFPYYVTAFTQGLDESIWIGSTYVYRYDKASDRASLVIEPKGLNTVDMFFDAQQDLWVAREHAGVYRFSGGEWTDFTAKDGLAGVSVSSLMELHDGSLLVASGEGISRYDGEVWVSDVYPKLLSMSRRWSRLRQTSDESIWFNFHLDEVQPAQLIVNGTNRFRTIRHRAETVPPQTSVASYLQRVAQPGNTHISWSGEDPWNVTPLDQLQYSWRLNGAEWSPFSSATSNTFLDLESGKHVLEVRARDLAFNIDPTPDRVEFYVVAPIWRQPWMIGLVVSVTALVTVLVIVIVRNRERYLLERQAEREEHLKDLDRVKTGFFTNISHELNTPLTLILEPLKRVLKTETDEKKRERISMAVRNANHVVTLVGQLLELQKLEMEVVRVDAKEGDLVAFLSLVVEDLQPMAQMHQVSLRFEGVEACVGYFDSEKLRKITQNLVGNSIKYTPPGGEVLFILQVDVSDGKRWMTLIVEDTGLGIPPESLKYVFDRYYRVPEHSIVDGSGIGLNLTKELVELCGGNIQVESPLYDDFERPGTRFTVYLPIDS